MSHPESSGSYERRSTLRLLLGLTSAGALSERTLHPSLVATYRLRTVAVGALITATALINFVVYMALPGHGRTTTLGFAVVVASGIFALGVAVLTPWNRVLVGRWALRALYGCSLYAILLVVTAIYFDGGGQSGMYVMLPVLIVFFAIAYPQRAQFVLFATTAIAYVAVVALRGWDLSAASLYIKLANLAITAYVSSVLSGWLVTEMRDRALSSSAADQRAGMLEIVARAARRISSLDAASVVGGALSAALELGSDEAEIWLLEGSPQVLTLQRRLSLTGDAGNDDLVREQFVKARLTGTTQMVETASRRVVVALLHREGEVVGVLVAARGVASGSDVLLVECIELLAAQVSAGLDVARNVAERRGLEERLAHWAFHDSLTDLPNRVLFGDRLELALARSARDGTNVAVLFLDLDDFKRINDTLGHAAGDDLLRIVAERLLGSLRPNDTLARYGGDEFVVLVDHITGLDSAVLVAQRILDALSELVVVGGQEMVVKTSIGIAITGARPGADTDVLRRADIAMYQAKAAGGSRFVLSPSPETEPRVRPLSEHEETG